MSAGTRRSCSASSPAATPYDLQRICPAGWAQVTVSRDPSTLLSGLLTLFIYSPSRVTVVCSAAGASGLPPVEGYAPTRRHERRAAHALPSRRGLNVRYFVEVSGETVALELELRPDGSYLARGAEGQELSVRSLAEHAGLYTLSIGGRVLEVQPHEREVRLAGQRFSAAAQGELERIATRSTASGARTAQALHSPMPGRIVRVLCVPGEAVPHGAALVVIEAMKMQNELCAKADQVVRAVLVAADDTVDRGAVLIEFE